MSQTPEDNLFRLPEIESMLVPQVSLTRVSDRDYQLFSAIWAVEEGRGDVMLDPNVWEVTDSPKAQAAATALADLMGGLIAADRETYAGFGVKRMSSGNPKTRESRHLIVSAGLGKLTLPEIRDMRGRIASEANALLAPLGSPFRLPLE